MTKNTYGGSFESPHNGFGFEKIHCKSVYNETLLLYKGQKRKGKKEYILLNNTPRCHILYI